MAKGHLIKRGRFWYARYYDNAGRRQWKSLQTTFREIAYAKFSQLILSIEKQEVGWQLKEKPLEEYLGEYLALCEVEHSKTTYRMEKQILTEFAQFVKARYLRQIATSCIEAYKVKRAKEVKKSTANRTIAILKAFLNRAVALGYLERNPARFVKKFKEEPLLIKHLSNGEVSKLLSGCSPRIGRIITIFLLTGMRLGELAYLRWKDIDFIHRLIHIQNRGDWTPKGHKPRVIPLHPVVEDIFLSLPRQDEQDYVLGTRSGKPIDSYLRWEILRCAKRVGVKANVKMFRSTFASNLVMSGVDIFTVSKLLGHYDVKITEKHYAHLTQNFLFDAIGRLKPAPTDISCLSPIAAKLISGHP